jgi:4-amino-4-deoxy-L-arabinose transferase-like glycosyltransferase
MAHRVAFSRILGLLALVITLVSTVMFLPPTYYEYLDQPFLVLLVAVVALGASLWFAPRLTVLPDLRSSAPLSARVHLRTAMLGVLGLLLLGEISGRGMGLHFFVSHHVQFLLLCLSLALVAWGLGGGQFRLSGLWTLDWWSDAALVIALTFLALVLRFWQLGTAIHFFVDEVNFTTAVSSFRTDFNAPLLAPFSSMTAFPWLFPYLQAEAVNLWGRNLEGLRAISAIMGTFTIPALYLLAKTLFDRKTAIIAALLLATFPPHMHFSRLGINNIADPLFGTLALAFLARGQRWGRRMDFAIGGVALGLTQYFYEGGRLLYPPLILVWLTAVFVLQHLKSRPSMESENPAAGFSPFLHVGRPTEVPQGGKGGGGIGVKGVLTCLLAALLVALPIYYCLAALQTPITARMSEAGLNGGFWQNILSSAEPGEAVALYLDHLKSAFAVYVHLSDGSLFFGGDQPILNFLTPFFLLGAAYALWRIRSPGTLLLFLWVLMTSIGNSLLTSSTHSSRYVVAFPAMMLLVALSIRYALPLFTNAFPRRLHIALLGALASALAVGQTAYYFGPHLKAYNDVARYSRSYFDGQDAAFRSTSFPRGTHIHLISRSWYATLNDDITILNFLADGLHMDSVWSRELTDEYLESLADFRDHAFFVEPEDRRTLRMLQEHFYLLPAQESSFNVPVGREFILYYAPFWQQPTH